MDITDTTQSLPLVSVIIANFNGAPHLEPCLNAVLAQDYPRFEVILADDGSTDGSAALVRERFPSVRVLENAHNRGFAAVNNQAIQASRGDYIITLNNDTRVEPDFLAEMVRVAESDPRIGSCAPLIILHHQGLVDSAGIEVDWAGIAWQRWRGKPVGESHAPEEVFGACAGAALYRRKMLDEIGLFDEQYFAYYEDVDLAWRAKLAGWRCIHVPTAIVYHVHSAFWSRQPDRKTYLLARNKLFTIVKNYPWPELLLGWPLILGYDLLSLSYAILRGQGISALRGRWDGLTHVSWALRQRRKVQALRTKRQPTTSMLARPRVRLGLLRGMW
ncbi:glycosyltransferase family 2 protein [Candidatus Bathyarchaeota archaeon A05DMB-2]|nr:glycosyltransferase family 2 protein [Candidatus Bathyarchaeota archaeon A05DMB-2]